MVRSRRRGNCRVQAVEDTIVRGRGSLDGNLVGCEHVGGGTPGGSVEAGVTVVLLVVWVEGSVCSRLELAREGVVPKVGLGSEWGRLCCEGG